MKIRIVGCFTLALGLSVAGCGSKKAKVEGAADLGDAGTDGGSLEAAGMEPEADTGPTKYPKPPTQSPGDRTPYKFKISINKAFVLPLSEDGKCWDQCKPETKKSLAESLVQLATIDKPGDKYAMAAKAVAGTVGAQNGSAALPDIYVHLDCGFEQMYTTSKTSAADRLAATWRGAYETLKIDVRDMCSISVWDADDDGNDEMIGTATIQLAKRAVNKKLTLFGGDEDFGQVFLVDLDIEQLEGTPPNTGGGQTGGGSTQPPPPPPPTKPGAAWYTVEITKANLKAKKDDGQAWDAKIPFLNKGDGKSPDPFVEAFLNGYMSENPFMVTDVAKDKNYYEWRMKGRAELKPSDKIHFMVWDKDMADNDMIGTCITDPIGSIKSGHDIVFRGCGQVDFLVVKITKQ